MTLTPKEILGRRGTLLFKGDGVLSLYDRPCVLKQLRYIASSPGSFFLKEKGSNSIAEQVMDRLVGRSKSYYGRFELTPGMEFTSGPLSMYLDKPSEIEVKFGSGGYLQIWYEIEMVE